jgi:hypothetical protein
MSDLTVNGAPVLRGDLLLPRVGAWTADLTLDAESAPTGSVTIASPAGLRLVGTAERSRAVEGRVEVRVRGGAGGLRRELAPVAYRPVGGVRVRTILDDWARESGETLSSAIAPALLGEVLTAWTRERGSSERSIRALARALGCSWRFDPDGALLLVRETWPTVDPDGVTVLREDPINDAIELGVDVPLPAFVPGVTWQGRRVSSVEAFIIGNGTHRVRLLFENDSTTTERDRCAVKYNVFRFGETDDRAFARTYLARVVAQSADLSTVDVELEPDVAPERRVMPGLVRVPLYGSVPGGVIELDIAPGGEAHFCLVTFLNGDRAKPCIIGWLGSPSDNSGKRGQRVRVRAAEIQLGEGAARKVARDTDPVGPNTAMTAWMTEVSARLTTIFGTVGPVVIPTALDPLEPPTGNIATIADGSPYVKTD